MKTKFTLLLLGTFIISLVHSATIVVTVTNNQFTPANITNVRVGDIVRFNFQVGFHNATSNDVANALPAGASPINSGNPASNVRTYDYTATVPGVYKYICDVHADAASFTGMVGQFTVQSALPATLKQFNVAFNNKKPEISWTTLTELNVSHFSVRTSVDGVNFAEIAKVAAAGNSVTERSYAYSDASVLSARYVYYMLAIVDKDGQEKFSDMKVYRNNLATQVLIARMNPNPVPRNGQLMLQFNAEKQGQMLTRVYDAAGKFVMQAKMSAFPGLNNGHLHAGELPSGTYTAEFLLDGVKETRKLIVQ